MSKRMVTYSVSDDDKIASIDGYAVGGGVGDKSISRRMITYKVDDTGKIISIDGHELSGGGGGYETNTLQDVIDNKGGDGKPSCYKLLWGYLGTSVDSILTSVDTSKSTSMEGMLWGCENLITIPQIDTSSSTNMKSMFYECKKITTIPQLNTSNVTSMNSMFYYCHKLTNVPVSDTSNVTDMGYMFYNCQELTSIPSLNVANVTSFTSIFSSCYKLTSIGMHGFTRSIDISSTKLNHDALVAFLNQAGAAYNSSQKITMGSTKLALLSDEEKAIATNKGWTLA